VLIDDTVTTGASLLSAAEALLQQDPDLDLYLLALAQEA
jgi:predicted amidophosphoribosyltransferase